LDETVYWPTDSVISSSGEPLAEYGDFAVAIVAAHEVGHHVQNELGILEAEEARQLETRSLQTELQADCFAGVWGYSAYYEGLVESGDMDEAMNLIPDIGDLPEQPRGGELAHGTPEERVEAFLTGYDFGEPDRCLQYTPLPEG
jgi:predicted metalloprotease